MKIIRICLSVTLLLIIAIFVRCNRPEPDTVVSGDWFRMNLPGKWESIYDKDADRWNFKTDAEQITVSYMLFNEPMAPDQKGTAIDQIIDVRRRAEQQVTTNHITLSETTVTHQGAVLLARYEGQEAVLPQRYFSCLVIANESTVGFFYYESVGLSYDSFQSRGRFAFNSISLGKSQQ